MFMKKAKKILLFGGLGLLVLIVVAVIVAGLFLGKIVTAGVNTVGPKITQTPLTVDAVDVSLLAGSATVKNLVVGNPDGFKSPNAISVGLAAVSVSPLSVLSDKIVVKSVRVESPEITFEGSLSGNNLSKIMDNVNGAAKNGGAGVHEQNRDRKQRVRQKNRGGRFSHHRRESPRHARFVRGQGGDDSVSVPAGHPSD